MKTKSLIALIGGLCVGAMVVVGGLNWAVDSLMARVMPERVDDEPIETETYSSLYIDSLPYDVAKPKENLDPAKPISWRVGYWPGRLSHDQQRESYEVFTDESLTHYADVVWSFSADRIQVKPGPRAGLADPGYLKRKAERAIPGWVQTDEPTFGVHEHYYVVERRDRMTGKKRAKPLVTRYSFATALAAPQVRFAVEPDGFLSFSWDPIPGASEYYVIVAQRGAHEREPLFDLLSATGGKTSFSMRDDRRERSKDDLVVSAQNSAISSPLGEIRMDRDDPILGREVVGDLTDLAEVGVIAAGGGQFSPYRGLPLSEFAAVTPLKMSNDAAEAEGAQDLFRARASYAAIPTHLPVDMADGTTQRLPVDINVASSYERYGEAEVAYSIVGTALRGRWTVPCPDPAKFKQTLATLQARNLAARAKTGGLPPQQSTGDKGPVPTPSPPPPKPAPKPAPPTQPAPRPAPPPLPVTATNPYSEHLARQLLLGATVIDAAPYLSEPGMPSTLEAIREALAQNPLIPDIETYAIDYGSRQILIDYGKTKARHLAEIKKVSDEAKRVVKKLGLRKKSDKAKALAINNYLVKTAEYDYKALRAHERGEDALKKYPHAWTPAGVLLKKKGVCASYADAFKVLADAAGLQAVVVTGVSSGERHAWNKMKVKGKWYVIDVTWNDGPDRTRYFGLTDAQAKKDHGQDRGSWVLAAFVSKYNTPKKPLSP